MKKILLTSALCLFTSLAQAAVYWVQPGGTMSGCTASASPPANSGAKATISAGVGCLSAGDTLYIRAGTYSSTADDFDDNRIPSGGGTGTRTKVMPYNGEIVLVRQGIGCGSVFPNTNSYIQFGDDTQSATTANLVLDGTNCNAESPGIILYESQGMLITHVELKSWPGPGLTYQTGVVAPSNNTIRYNLVHDNGHNAPSNPGGLQHGIYSHGTDQTIEYNQVYRNGYAGIQAYDNHPGFSTDRTTIRFNNVYDNGEAGIIAWGGAAGGTGHQVYGNIVRNNGLVGAQGSGAGISILNTSSTIANNTIYGSRTNCILVQVTTLGALIENNICQANGSTINTDVAGQTINYNLCYLNTTGTCAGANSKNGQNPLFASLPAFDFRLQSGSPAISAGTIVGGSTDIAGTTRTVPYDIGAYEFGAVSGPVVTISTSNYTTSTQTPTILLQGTASGTGF